MSSSRSPRCVHAYLAKVNTMLSLIDTYVNKKPQQSLGLEGRPQGKPRENTTLISRNFPKHRNRKNEAFEIVVNYTIQQEFKMQETFQSNIWIQHIQEKTLDFEGRDRQKRKFPRG